MSLVDELKSAVTPRAALLVVGVLALQLLFIASYVGALHDPEPKDVPFGVVAPPQVSAQLVGQLEKLPGEPLDPRSVTDEAEARQQILNRDIDGALLVNPARTTDTLLVASGGGTVLSSSLEALFTRIEGANQRTVRTVDVAPASPQDFDGLSAFYLVVGWCVGGYICAAILAISAGSRPANRERAIIRLGVLAVYAILGGLGGAVIVGPILGALPGSVVALWGLGALVVFAVGATTLALQALFGIVGIGLAILLVVIAGNPSAGGAFPLPMLPPFWKAIGPGLPPGAGTWVARSIAYFKGNDVTFSLLVLAAWAVVGSAITLVMSSLKRKPGTEPIAEELGAAGGAAA
ncbi:ABC transporter permease [Streptomyces sp. Je 1-79]|uniref:ABC transporter permease n=1 Tax=Streptomyces sp. Je 1-79 TaxID=2943847 RepID=UPI0021A5D24A|nr:ABC transporter permease [Streptomyces sp. Je 1-79]MCT4357336.1 ABC transporter permease [Streptomyces sp. Je 1-79]